MEKGGGTFLVLRYALFARSLIIHEFRYSHERVLKDESI